MTRRHRLVALIGCLWLFITSASNGEITERHRRSVTGTYETGDGSAHLDVLQLPHHCVRLYLRAKWKDHFGEVLGVFALRNHTAIYKARSGGILVFRFLDDRVEAVQNGSDLDCDFGVNVSAGGVYRLRSRRVPTFHPVAGEG